MKNNKLTLSNAAQKISANKQIPKYIVYDILRAYVDIVKETMANGEDVGLTGIGKFKIVKRKNTIRALYDLKTKEVKIVNLPPANPSFEFTDTFREYLNKEYKDKGNESE